jgi:hypothetical protein
MNRSLNRKTGRKPGKTGKNRPKPEKTGLKKLLIFLIEKIKKNPQIKWGQSHTTKSHIK